MENNNLHIIELKATNFKRLKAVCIRFDGSPVIIGGNNGQGKSSVLDAIFCALAGKKALPDEPIRQGKERSKLDLTLSDGTRIAAKIEDGRKMTITVRDPQGVPVKGGPMSFLDALTAGGLALDPLAFELASDKERAKILREIVDHDGRISALDQEHSALYETRREIGVTARQAQAAADASAVDYDCPDPVDVSAAVTELDAARRHNAAIEDASRAIEARISAGKDRKARIAEMHSEREELERRLAALVERIATEEAALDAARTELHAARAEHAEMEPIDTAPIEARIRDAEDINARVRAHQNAARLADIALAERLRYDEATERLAEILAEQQAILAAADLGVDGVGWDPEREIITVDGVPYTQASQSARTRVAVAFAVARQPKLPLVLIRDGSRLDRKHLRELYEACQARGIQAAIEVVGDDHPDATIIIEDGEVRP